MARMRVFGIDCGTEFTGYGVDAPAANHVDYRDKDMKGAAVVWLGSAGPKGLDQSLYRRLLSGRSRYATEQLGAAAAIGPAMTAASGAAGGPGRSGASGAATGQGGFRNLNLNDTSDGQAMAALENQRPEQGIASVRVVEHY